MRQSIKVRHNMEMAHRLYETKGKCEAIHGHSWWVELEIEGEVSAAGMVLEFGAVKKQFREHLDSEYDHRIILNDEDPWVSRTIKANGQYVRLPGLREVLDDPTTENVAKWIGQWAQKTFDTEYSFYKYRVTVWETTVNAATWESM